MPILDSIARQRYLKSDVSYMNDVMDNLEVILLEQYPKLVLNQELIKRIKIYVVELLSSIRSGAMPYAMWMSDPHNFDTSKEHKAAQIFLLFYVRKGVRFDCAVIRIA